MIASLVSALQFLTVIPLKISRINSKNMAQSMVFFPVIGLLLGLILAGIGKFLSFLGFQSFSLNIILIVSLIILTGGLHLDGLSDTADAFLSRKNKEEMLKIMRDSHVGVMGALSLISVISLKIAFLFSVEPALKIAALLLMCVLSRWSMVFTIFLFPYARQEGKAKIFSEGVNFKIFSLAALITLILAVLIWQLKGLFIFALAATSVYIIGKAIKKKLGGITGDTLGAINELTEVAVLFMVCILGRS